MIRADLVYENAGSIVLVASASPRGLRWLRRHVPDAITIAAGESVVCDHRCGWDIVNGAAGDGLRVRSEAA